MTVEIDHRHDQAATLHMELKADSGYTSEVTGLRISAEQWAVINKIVNSKDGVSRRLLDEIYNEHVCNAK